VTTLAAAKEEAGRKGFGSPAIVAIGAIVALREVLAPFAIGLETVR
jgi:siroheme synthase